MTAPTKPLGIPEFVTLLAMMVSILALSIDAMLPALGQIGVDLGVSDVNDTQLIISVRRQGFWHQRRLKLRESSAHLVDCIMRRACCDASVAFRVSFV